MERCGRIVLASIETEDGLRCVDIFRTNAGAIFWDEWRRDPEDPRGWQATGRRAKNAFETEAAALRAAKQAINWMFS